MKTALVLSAGGMFGAYQAGVWKALAPVFQPDLVVGASIGALNGWTIAGGCSPQRLIDFWLGLQALGQHRWRMPPRWRDGLLDSDQAYKTIDEICNEFQPRVDFGLVATDTLRLRPVLFCSPEVTCLHLKASAAMLGFFSQQRINGRLFSDGGLLDAMPVWAAVEMGAQRVIAVNVLPRMPGFVVNTVVGAVRLLTPYRVPALPRSIEVIRIEAAANLGPPRDAIYWTRENAARWIRQGEADAQSVIESGRLGWAGLVKE